MIIYVLYQYNLFNLFLHFHFLIRISRKKKGAADEGRSEQVSSNKMKTIQRTVDSSIYGLL
jgi:hypothetical protein